MSCTTLPRTGIETSRLGYGCTEFFGVKVSRRQEGLRVLGEAWDAGIRHFDVARLYGDGLAEGLLGDFLKDRRDEATITTKVGLFPPRFAGLKRLIKAAAAPLLRSTARGRAAPRRVEDEGAVRGQFDPDAMRASIETSFQALGTDRIDILMLHEGDAAAVQDPRVRDLLRDLKDTGRIRAIGVGAVPVFVRGILDLPEPERDWIDVIQTSSHFMRPVREELRGRTHADILTHSALRPLSAALALAQSHPDLAAAWSDRLACDLRDRRAVAGLAMAYALARNPDGPVVFSSLSPGNMRANRDAIGMADRLTPEKLQAIEEWGRVLVEPLGTRPEQPAAPEIAP